MVIFTLDIVVLAAAVLRCCRCADPFYSSPPTATIYPQRARRYSDSADDDYYRGKRRGHPRHQSKTRLWVMRGDHSFSAARDRDRDRYPDMDRYPDRDVYLQSPAYISSRPQMTQIHTLSSNNDRHNDRHDRSWTSNTVPGQYGY
jgi:hypothetical protein